MANKYTQADLSGQRFGLLTVIREAPYCKRRLWLCQCDCGQTKVIQHSNLTTGRVPSCGCLPRISGTTTHGKTNTPEYRIWSDIFTRCYNPNATGYARYGGRGIFVEDCWRSFEVFLADMGERPSSCHSIERKDNNGPYGPTNCIWVTLREQSRNRRSNIRITFQGKTLVAADWATLTGLDAKLIRLRYHRGLPPHLILSPIKNSR